MTRDPVRGALLPPAFEWCYLTPLSDSNWRDDVTTVHLELSAEHDAVANSATVKSALEQIEKAGTTRVVIRSSQWPEQMASKDVWSSSGLVFDLDANPNWIALGLVRELPHEVSKCRLSTVVVNTTIGEGDALLELLRVWSLPKFAPLAEGDEPFRLVILLNQETDEDFRQSVIRSVDTEGIASAVSSVEFLSLNIPAEYDRYVRDGQGEPGRYGHKSGPNVQFFRGLDALNGSDGFALVVEVDTRPVRRGWVSAARAEVARQPDAWIIGSVYRGPDRLRPPIRHHLNGNAIYSLGDSFAAFRQSYWEPLLIDLVLVRPDIAYDFALNLAMSTAVSGQPTMYLIENWHRFRSTSYIQNLVVWNWFDTDTVDWSKVVEEINEKEPQTYVIHGVRGYQQKPWA